MAPRTSSTIVTGAEGSRSQQIHVRGHEVLDDPQLNRGTAFSPEERDHLGLHGMLPSGSETIDEQVARCYEQFRATDSDVEQVGLPDPAPRQQRGALLPAGGRARPRDAARSSTRPRSVRRSSSSATSSGGRSGPVPQRSRTSTASIGPWTPRGWGRTTSTCSWPPTPRRSSVSATGVSAGSTSRSGSSRSTRLRPGSTRVVCWRWVWTSARTAKSSSTTPATSACVVHECGATSTTRSSTPMSPARRRAFPNAILHWEDFSGPPARGILARYGDTLCTFDDDIQGTAAVGLACALAGVTGLGWSADRSADRRLRCRVGRGRYRRPDRTRHDRGRTQRRRRRPTGSTSWIGRGCSPATWTTSTTTSSRTPRTRRAWPAGAPLNGTLGLAGGGGEPPPDDARRHVRGHRCLRREGHPRDARALSAADHPADVQPHRARRADSGEPAGLDGRRGAGRDRQSVRARRARRDDVPHRSGEQRSDVPRARARSDRVPRRDDAAVVVHRRGPGAREARGPDRSREGSAAGHLQAPRGLRHGRRGRGQTAMAAGIARVQVNDPIEAVHEAMWMPEYLPIKH